MSQLPPLPTGEPWRPPPGWYSARYGGPGGPGRRFWGCLGLSAVLIVGLVTAGVIIGRTSKSGGGHGPTATIAGPGQIPATTDSPLPGCSPQPCATVGGMLLTVRVVKRDLPAVGNFVAPAPDDHGVALELTFRNKSSQRAMSSASAEFRLSDAARRFHEGVGTFDDLCHVWAPVEMDPGASFGPKRLCFLASGPTAPITLVWIRGPLDPYVDIPLP